MKSQKGKRPGASAVASRYILMPDQANPYGTAFGGAIVAWMDMTAAMAAQRHCGREVVTVSIESLSFKEPIYLGDHVVLKARVDYVGRTSLEVGVEVSREDPYTGRKVIATTGHLTFVALDENKKPVAVPPILPVTKQEKERYQNAARRAKERKGRVKKGEAF